MRAYLAAMATLAASAGGGPTRCFSASTTTRREVDVVIALGTNMGNRGLNLHLGLQRLRELGVQVLRHSALYETAAAYVTDQPSFLNAAVLARTALEPGELLRVLKQVEADAGRDLAGGQRFGPRPLDLDVVFYGAGSYRDERLEVPHPRWRERPFVQAPVSDLLYRRDTTCGAGSTTRTSDGSQADSGATTTGSSPSTRGWSGGSGGGRGGAPGSDAASSGSGGGGGGGGCRQPLPTGDPGSVLNHLREVRHVWWERLRSGGGGGGASSSGGGGAAAAAAGAAVGGGEVMRRVTPLVNLAAAAPPPPADASGAGAGALLSWGCRTHLMAILNVTPDSFSDGGRHTGSVAEVVAAAEAMVSEGADLLDVGGQSTRPGATRLSPEKELGRVMPVLRALRESPRLRSVPLSVDTFYSQVAREAVAAGGANIVNDVSGGAADPDMLSTVAGLGVPYILMHMRGEPATMGLPQHTTYTGGGVWRQVGSELQAAAEAAEAAGLAAWNIILDPGIGFAKTADGNVELLRNLGALRRDALDGPYASAGPHHDSGGGGGFGGGGFGGPLLVGPSRKRFLGSLTGRERPADRDAATAAACVVCVCGGADMVRVHAVREVRDALRVADAVYRRSSW